jgi:hypothetical protein
MTTINEYNNSFIYKIISTASNFQEQYTYYGSTKRTLKIRMDKHRNDYKNNNLDCSSKKVFDMYGMNNCFIQLVQNCNCNDKYELWLIEAFYIKNNLCCNSKIPTGIKADNMKEYHKEYYEIHNEDIKKNNKEYRESHKEDIKKYSKEYGKTYRENHKEREKERDRINYLKKSQDPDFKAEIKERNRIKYLKKKDDPDFKEKNKERSRINYLKNSQDPDFKAEIKERNIIRNLKNRQDPEYKEREKERNRLYYLNKKAENKN